MQWLIEQRRKMVVAEVLIVALFYLIALYFELDQCNVTFYAAADGMELCVFRKPTGTSGKGLYELKQECYSEYSPYYYHYTRTEQAKV